MCEWSSKKLSFVVPPRDLSLGLPVTSEVLFNKFGIQEGTSDLLSEEEMF